MNTESNFPFPTRAKPTMKHCVPVEPTTARQKKASSKTYRAQLLADAVQSGVSIVHIFNEYAHKGGLTIAFKPCNDYKSCIMVEVAVNTCSPLDSFSRTIGTQGALEKFFAGETIQLPLLRHHTKDSLNTVVKCVFTDMYLF